MRICRYLALCGIASRRKAVDLVEKKVITINGRLVLHPATELDPQKDEVRCRRKLVKPPELGVMVVHKPVGVESTLGNASISSGRTLKGYVRDMPGYVAAGRLDVNSSGLMILSNDGELVAKLTHPRYEIPRTYHVKIRGHLTEQAYKKLTGGVRLSDGFARATSVSLVEELELASWISIEVTEGRNRLVRRMLDKLGYIVIKLIRVQHGPFHLGQLKIGEKRRLSYSDYQRCRDLIMGKS